GTPTTMIEFPPGLILVLGALLMPFVGGVGMRVLSLVLPLLTLAAVWMVPDGAHVTASFMGAYELVLVHKNAPTMVFATIFSIMAFGGVLVALNQDRRF